MRYDVSRLTESILAENQVITDLIDLAQQKKQAVILGEIDELTGIMRRENHLLHALEKAEAGRDEESRALARSVGIETEDLTASSLVTRLKESGTADTVRLSDSIDTLAANLERLKDLNRNNTVLLEQSLTYVESIEALLTRQRETTYSAGGSVKESPSRSVLDKRV